MDARIVKAIVDGDVALAKLAIDASTASELNYIFRRKNVRPYTILDVAISESVGKKPEHPIHTIIGLLRTAEAKTYLQIQLPPIKNTMPKPRLTQKNGIAIKTPKKHGGSRKSRRARKI
jgi:hypothetical protein